MSSTIRALDLLRPAGSSRTEPADPASALHRLRHPDTHYPDITYPGITYPTTSDPEVPREPEDDGEGSGHLLSAKEATDHGAAPGQDSSSPDSLVTLSDGEVKEAKSAKNHGRKAVYLTDRGGEYALCPHCGERLSDRTLYTDAKGWTFHRPCLHRGAIKVREKRAAPVFLLDYLLPPDAQEFDLTLLKQSQLRGGGRSYNAPNSDASNARDRSSILREQALSNPTDLLDIDPNVALPLLGTVGGALMGPRTRPRGLMIGALRGLAAGGGAALGQHVAGAYSGGDLGARLTAGAGGGALAYLLARAVTPTEQSEED